MEIVNKRKACQEILSTQKYLPDFNIKARDFWICYYLKTILRLTENGRYAIREKKNHPDGASIRKYLFMSGRLKK